MTTAATTPGESRSRTASAIVLGADAVLAAHPATAVQLAHACLRAGYSTVIPASWGDELLAGETIRQLRASDARPLVYCACPHVSDRLLDVGDDLAPFLVSVVSPPVATARHLRELARAEPLEITFVGACPSGDDEAIDARFMPADFLAMLAHRGIVLLDQPEVFDSVLPPDRRRHRSLPGGVPTADALWSEGGRRALIEIMDAEALTELAQHLASGEPALLDLGPALGCACSGAVAGTPPRSARSAVCALEPPHSTSEIVEPSPLLQLSRPLQPSTGVRESKPVSPPFRESSVDEVAALRVPALGETVSDESSSDRGNQPEPQPAVPLSDPTEAEQIADTGVAPTKQPFHRRRSAPAPARAASGSLPVTNSGEGRALPRAYVARRSSRRRSGEAGHAEPDAMSPERQDSEAGVTAASRGRAQSQSLPTPSVRNGSGSSRVFASVPIAVAQPATRETQPASAPAAAASSAVSDEPVSASVATAVLPDAPAPSAADTASGRTDLVTAPLVALRERARRFARRSEERPVYLGILIAIVAVLSIALGMAAGRVLRGATPVTADPVERGAAADSVFGTSAPDHGARDDSREADPPTPSNRAPGTQPTPRPPAPDRPQTRRAPGADAIQQSASGNVVPEVSPRTSAERPRPPVTIASDRATPGAAIRDSLAADSARRATAREDLVRSDSLARDSARPALLVADSAVRSPRDSTTLIRPGVSTTDSLFQRQRDELRRELEDRQRRIDSLQRWLDSARRVPPPPPTTPPPSR